MKRYLAKTLIQYFYDSHSSTAKTNDLAADPLPRWLRGWIEGDVQLSKFEMELKRLEHRLVSQAEQYAENWNTSIDPTSRISSDVSTFARSISSTPMLSKPMAFAVLAAGLACILLAAGWSAWNANSDSQRIKNIATREKNQSERLANEPQPSAEPLRREQLARSTWEATKRLAREMKQRSGQANNAIAHVDKRAFDTPIREVGGELLRFVAQKLPQATVRLLGMSHPHEGI